MRSSHEDIECLEQAAANVLHVKAKRLLDVNADYCSDFLTQEIFTRAKQLVETYDDVDSSWTDELRLLSGDSKVDVWRVFYNRIQGAKEFSRSHPEKEGVISNHGSEFWYSKSVAKARLNAELFTAEEGCGKYLDLSYFHNQFLNLHRLRQFLTRSFVQSQWNRYLKQEHMEEISFDDFFRVSQRGFKSMDYIAWLRKLPSFDWIPRHIKYKQSDYEEYLTSIDRYLVDFLVRLRPLSDLTNLINKFDEDFAETWSKREIPGWDQLTAELPLYAIVTDRVFSTKVALDGHVGSKDYAKAHLRYEKLSPGERDGMLSISHSKDRALARLESRIRFHLDQLGDIVENTIDHITRKQARTSREVELELLKLEQGGNALLEGHGYLSDAESSDGEEVDTDNRALYNPKNLPIGPDGKPIPYWQYKLFGLDKEFVCEICGNHTYFGRRAFDKHFSEWRHINGLRALRIQSSNHFFGITGIQDAILLHDRLRKQTSSSIFNADKEMECEDAMGNIMSYKAYNDLVRQGLV